MIGVVLVECVSLYFCFLVVRRLHISPRLLVTPVVASRLCLSRPSRPSSCSPRFSFAALGLPPCTIHLLLHPHPHPPSGSAPVGVTDCHDSADPPLRPPLLHARPRRALITPRRGWGGGGGWGIISGRDQILKHDGSVLAFK